MSHRHQNLIPLPFLPRRFRANALMITLLLAGGLPAADAGLDLLGDEPPPPPAASGVPTDPEADIALARRAQTKASGLIREGLDNVRRYNQDQARNATAIVDAAIAFGKARAMLPAGTDPEITAEIQANLFWCKKQMNLESLQDYVARKGEDFSLATKQMDAVALAKVDPVHAVSYFARAERYADSYPTEYLQIAIRFTEVAERFPGSPEGTKANQRAAAAVQAQMTAMQQAAVAARETRFTRPAKVVPGATPMPPAAAQKEALNLLKKTYAKQYAKKDGPAKARFALRLIDESSKNKADPAIFHQMLTEAVRLAGEAEAYEPLLDGVERLAASFTGIDPQLEKQAALKRLGSKPVAAAILKLTTEAHDPAANLAVGKWYCFAARRWDEGFRLLALGSDPELAKLADLELAKPKGSSEAMQSADAWYDGSLKQKSKDDKIGMQTRAMHWYQQAVVGIDGLAKQRVAQRIAEIDKFLPLDPANIDWAAVTPNQWDKLKGRGAAVNARVDRFDPGIALAAGERVRVVPHPADTWSIVFDGWYTGNARTESCDWRGYNSDTFYYGQGENRPGALMVWVENREKQNAGIIAGPGRVYFAPHILWATGDRAGSIRVKLVPVADDE